MSEPNSRQEVEKPSEDSEESSKSLMTQVTERSKRKSSTGDLRISDARSLRRMLNYSLTTWTLMMMAQSTSMNSSLP
jgi:hypothetical protein